MMNAVGEPATPDFYQYPWRPITSCTLRDGFAIVAWADGVELSCYCLWLAENTYGIEAASRESTLDPADLPDPAHLVHAAVGDSGDLVLRWGDGESSQVHPGWLRHVAEGQHEARAFLPELRPWTSATISAPPTVDGADVLSNDKTLREWLNLLCEFGMARLTNARADEGLMGELAARIGPIRGSNFGDVFDVRTKAQPDSTANTALNLGQHTDLPTRETPPGFQFLHCVENEVAGGLSRLTDGLSVVAELRENHPADYQALTTLKWTFFNRSTFADHRWTGPIIDNTNSPYPLTLRAFYPVRGFPAMDNADVPRAYEAMRTFSTIAHDPEFQISYPFAPGDLVGFDNRRVLHGRDSFDAGAGSRWLRGCYIDQDDAYSRLRILNRSEQERQATTTTPNL
ncbi:MAG: TauD/TfdA family dioxygenase [Acidimicrobiales bacterium]